jgi:hypothetical protein
MTYNPFKPVIQKFKRRKVITRFRNDVWGIDLIDMSKEDPTGYILVTIDYFSRRVQTRFMKRKTKLDFDNAMYGLLHNNLYLTDVLPLPKNIHSDLEGAFVYSKVLPENKINLYHTNFLGSPITERVIRSLREIMRDMMYKDESKDIFMDWTNYIEPATDYYNNRIHRSIEMTPNQAWILSNVDDVEETPIDLYYKNAHIPSNHNKPKFKVNDKVVISRNKNKFEKGHTIRWNKTEFTIIKILHFDVFQYVLNNGKTYYAQQLQLIL